MEGFPDAVLPGASSVLISDLANYNIVGASRRSTNYHAVFTRKNSFASIEGKVRVTVLFVEIISRVFHVEKSDEPWSS
jgi:hypothetical protein